jgi:aspartyl-tRNA(Asn)/glutamyl-tRNA(Gln) amidotransferase subunit A
LESEVLMTSRSQTAAADVAPHSLARLSATQMLDGYRAGEFTPRDVVDDVIDALKGADALCNVMTADMFASARSEADRAAAAWKAGEAKPLTGVPITVKDLVYVAGTKAQAGAPALDGFVPDVDAAVVAAVKDAGGIITCKTTTCESGYKLTADSPVSGITRNPWNLNRTSGGSSGGAAAAVAAGCGPLAIATDGVGSIRVPSAFCGVFGLKPTYGLVPRSPGFFPPSWPSLAHTGPIARNVSDAALLLGVIASYDRRDPGSLPIAGRTFAAKPRQLDGLRIGFSPDLGYAAVAGDVRAAFKHAIDALADLGAELTAADPGVEPDVLEEVLQPIAFTEQAASVDARDPALLSQSDQEYRDVITKGRTYSGVDYMRATHRRMTLRGRFVDLFRRIDVLVTPTVAVTAFAAGTIGVEQIDGRKVDRHLGWSPFTWPINLAGLPAATIPCGCDRDGMPIGLQVVAPWFGEDAILSVAAAFEQARPWADAWPKLSGA